MASARDLRLQVILQAIDKATAPLRGISGRSAEAAKALKAARDQLKDLNAQQAAVQRFRELQAALKSSQEQARAVRARIEELRNAQTADAAAAQAQARELAAAEKVLRSLTKATEQQTAALRPMREQLQRLGITNVAADEKRLATAIEETTAAAARQRAELDRLAATQKRLAAARSTYDRSQRLAGNLASAGVATGAAGAAVGLPVATAVRDFASFEDAMLGIARQVPGARDDINRLTEVYAAIRQQVHELGREIPIATNEIAQMFTAGARMEVPTDALKEFTRISAMMAVAFDAVPEEITESMGKVGKAFKIPVTQIQGLADSINYLDDNAISKGKDIINVLTRISGVVSTVKMSASDAAALASTLLTLNDTPEVAATAINAITQKLAAAEKGSKKFQEAMKEIGLRSKDVQKGMQVDAAGTFDKVANAIRALPQDKRIGVMVELVGLEHSDTLAKLVNQGDELQRQRDLANNQQAAGSMAREMAARQATLSAQWQMGKNRAYELSTTLGESLKPALINVMGTLGPIVERTAAWARENPALVGWLMKGAAALSLLLVGMGALTLALAALIGPFAVIRYGLALLPVLAPMAATVIGGLSAALKGMALAAAANPFLLTVAALGTAAALLYTHWDAVVAWMDRLPARLAGLAGQFAALGSEMMQGLINGVSRRLGAVRDTVREVADAAIGMFKDALGIRSPSRVFIAAGGEISAGAAQGILGQQDLVRRAALAMSAAATVALPPVAVAAQQLQPMATAVQQLQPMATAVQQLQPPSVPTLPSLDPGIRIDRRPPLSAAASAGAPVVIHNTNTVTIHAPPGMDPQALARAVSDELDRRDRAAAARRRSSLYDSE